MSKMRLAKSWICTTLSLPLTLDRLTWISIVVVKGYVPDMLESSGAKRSWVINCTRYKRPMLPLSLNLTFDLIWISKGIIYSSRTMYPLSWKLLEQWVLELSNAQGLRDQHNFWPWPLTYWLEYQCRSRCGRPTWPPTRFNDCGAKHSWFIHCTRYSRPTWLLTLVFGLLTWISIRIPTKFEVSGAKHSWLTCCTGFGRSTWPLTLTFYLLTWLSIGIIYSSRTIYLPSLKLVGKMFLIYQLHKVKVYLHTNPHTVWPTCAKQHAPSFSKEGA